MWSVQIDMWGVCRSRGLLVVEREGEREREREREGGEGVKERERECGGERERERMWGRERERENVGERERESVEGSGEDGEGEQEVMGMRWQCWLLKAREVIVTLVTSLRRDGMREATKTLL